jgi:hypothetical protein
LQVTSIYIFFLTFPKPEIARKASGAGLLQRSVGHMATARVAMLPIKNSGVHVENPAVFMDGL